MKKHLIVTPTTGMSRDDWFAFRSRGIGASEVGTILGMNQYESKLELFYKKIDPAPRKTVQTISQFMGHYHEDAVADLWQYWDGTEAGMIKNFEEGRIVRRCRRINAYVQNPKYPWLFVSLDRIINKGERGEEGALELKTIAGYEADKWEAGIPPSHLVQVFTQMFVCEFLYGEIAAQKDGRYFDVYEFAENKTINQRIIEETKSFWDKVVRGREIMNGQYEAKRNFNQRLYDELQEELVTLEPEPDGTEAYEKYLKEKFKRSIAEAGVIAGTDADFKEAQKLISLKAKIKDLEDSARKHSNTLKRRIGDGQKLDFGKNGFISWKGEPRTFLLRLKQQES